MREVMRIQVTTMSLENRFDFIQNPGETDETIDSTSSRYSRCENVGRT